MGSSRPLFLYFRLFNTVDSKQCSIKIMPMTGIELQTSGVGSNWALSTEPQPLPKPDNLANLNKVFACALVLNRDQSDCSSPSTKVLHAPQKGRDYRFKEDARTENKCWPKGRSVEVAFYLFGKCLTSERKGNEWRMDGGHFQNNLFAAILVWFKTTDDDDDDNDDDNNDYVYDFDANHPLNSPLSDTPSPLPCKRCTIV